ncbi:MAG: hypothetical protein Q8P52_01975 [bacterium]|nr:hypothetical protein [bacterium]
MPGINPLQERRRAQSAKKAKKAAALILGFAVVFFMLTVIVTRLHVFTLGDIQVYGASFVPKSEIINASQKIIEGGYVFGLFPKSSVFLYPKANLRKTLSEKFPSLSETKIGLSDFTALVITVKERKPEALWCGEKKSESENIENKCFFVDENGFVYARAPDFSPGVYMKIYGPLRYPGPLPPGAYIFREKDWQKVKEISISMSEAAKLEILEYIEKEAEVAIVFENGTELYISSKENWQETAKKLENAVGEIERTGLFLKDIEYIDARIPNKVFYKTR